MDYWKAPIVPSAPVICHNPFHIPWVAYLAPKLATGFVVPQGDMRIEHAQGGGLLLSATEDRFDPTNPDHLRRAHELAEIMIARTGDGANSTRTFAVSEDVDGRTKSSHGELLVRFSTCRP